MSSIEMSSGTVGSHPLPTPRRPLRLASPHLPGKPPRRRRGRGTQSSHLRPSPGASSPRQAAAHRLREQFSAPRPQPRPRGPLLALPHSPTRGPSLISPGSPPALWAPTSKFLPAPAFQGKEGGRRGGNHDITAGLCGFVCLLVGSIKRSWRCTYPTQEKLDVDKLLVAARLCQHNFRDNESCLQGARPRRREAAAGRNSKCYSARAVSSRPSWGITVVELRLLPPALDLGAR